MSLTEIKNLKLSQCHNHLVAMVTLHALRCKQILIPDTATPA